MGKGTHAPDFSATTPLARRGARNSLLLTLGKFVALPAIPIGLLLVFGSPALRIHYAYDGAWSDPRFIHCTYFSLNGWHEIQPLGFEANPCPVVTFVPLEVRGLLGDLP